MSKNILSEISRMKNLFGYERGKVISEQKHTISEQVDVSKLPLGTEGNLLDNLKLAGINGVQDPNFKKYYEWNDAIGSYYKRQTPLTTNTTTAAAEAPAAAPAGAKKQNPTNKSGTASTGDSYLIPQELKSNIGGKTGVEAFQDWLDQKKPGWHKKYQKLGGEKLKGYGKYGPNTSSVWATYKNEFIKDNPQIAQDVKTITTTDKTATDKITAAPQQLKNATPIDTKALNSTDNSPKEFYKKLYDAGLFKGEGDRVKYKGPNLTPEQLDLLNKAFEEMGYSTAVSKGEKRYGQKYLWKKSDQQYGQEEVNTETSDTGGIGVPTEDGGETYAAIDKDEF